MKFASLKHRFRTLLLVCIILITNLLTAQKKPVDYFGFQPGSDRNLFTYEQLIAYLQELDTGLRQA